MSKSTVNKGFNKGIIAIFVVMFIVLFAGGDSPTFAEYSGFANYRNDVLGSIASNFEPFCLKNKITDKKPHSNVDCVECQDKLKQGLSVSPAQLPTYMAMASLEEWLWIIDAIKVKRPIMDAAEVRADQILGEMKKIKYTTQTDSQARDKILTPDQLQDMSPEAKTLTSRMKVALKQLSLIRSERQKIPFGQSKKTEALAAMESELYAIYPYLASKEFEYWVENHPKDETYDTELFYKAAARSLENQKKIIVDQRKQYDAILASEKSAGSELSKVKSLGGKSGDKDVNSAEKKYDKFMHETLNDFDLINGLITLNDLPAEKNMPFMQSARCRLEQRSLKNDATRLPFSILTNDAMMALLFALAPEAKAGAAVLGRAAGATTDVVEAAAYLRRVSTILSTQALFAAPNITEIKEDAKKCDEIRTHFLTGVQAKVANELHECETNLSRQKLIGLAAIAGFAGWEMSKISTAATTTRALENSQLYVKTATESVLNPGVKLAAKDLQPGQLRRIQEAYGKDFNILKDDIKTEGAAELKAESEEVAKIADGANKTKRLDALKLKEVALKDETKLNEATAVSIQNTENDVRKALRASADKSRGSEDTVQEKEVVIATKKAIKGGWNKAKDAVMPSSGEIVGLAKVDTKEITKDILETTKKDYGKTFDSLKSEFEKVDPAFKNLTPNKQEEVVALAFKRTEEKVTDASAGKVMSKAMTQKQTLECVDDCVKGITCEALKK